MWSGAVVCPASRCGLLHAAGLYGDARIRSKSLTRAQLPSGAALVCDLVGVDPKTVRRERPPDHAAIRKKMHEMAGSRRRFGYRRVDILLEREGLTMNEKKLYRIYKEEGLSVRRRRGRKRARGTRVPMPIPNRPNARWILWQIPSVRLASSVFWRSAMTAPVRIWG